MKPEWLKIDLTSKKSTGETAGILAKHHLNTICTSGLCPNRSECWMARTATLMIGGEICTRKCRFCNTLSGKPRQLNPDEPRHVAESIKALGLRYAVITSVDRDDLPDYGAAHWIKTIEEVRRLNPDTKIELLIPDFMGQAELIRQVMATHPHVAGHNMETVRRLTPSVRSVARYERSLDVLREITNCGITAKTGFMLGLGETHEEILETMDDILATGCRRLTLGQYLQPTAHHLPVKAYITPEQFAEYKQIALDKGFKHVVSGPLVRSSYHAAEGF
ncbi:lipoyl synthase [Prevotella fusca JCM 17724]|nr:lipoyl synthase [Prevotella fusca JCM 17724]